MRSCAVGCTQTTNLGVVGSNPPWRANHFNGLAYSACSIKLIGVHMASSMLANMSNKMQVVNASEGSQIAALTS